MDYNEALQYIHGALKFGVKLGLHNIKRLLEHLGNPHKKLKYVHVAGTNGKGSTVAFISSILVSSGYKVGIYTSPYLERFTERIRINENEISEGDLARITALVKNKVELMKSSKESHPTEFEIVTAIAFQYFYESKCDVVVLEVGLGGRFDSTNIIEEALLSVITTISYDHMDKLGGTLAEIAFEKAGIIKEQGDVVLYPQHVDAETVIKSVCKEKESKLWSVDFSKIDLKSFGVDGQEFNYEQYKSLRISLLGEHQVKNAVVSIKACEVLSSKGLNINEASIREGLLKALWPGRLEVLCREPLFIVDGAHNPQGAYALRDTLVKYFPEKKIIFIIGVLKDKDYKAMVEAVAPIASKFIVVKPENDRALDSTELAILVENYCKDVIISDKIINAVKTSLEACTAENLICSFGSLYYVGEVRKYFS